MNVLCPVCGKNCAEKIFNPSTLDADIYGVHVHGLGRGKGFAFGDRFSLLNPDHPVIDRIRDRIRDLSKILDITPPPRAKEDHRNEILHDVAEEAVATQRRHTDASRVAEDIMEQNVRLTRRVNTLRKQLEARNTIVEDLGEDAIRLQQEYTDMEDDRDHRLNQATKLLALAKRQKQKIRSLRSQVEEISELVVG